MAGLTFGIGGRTGMYAGSGGVPGTEQVFASPITPDLANANANPIQHPATWVLLGAAVWMGVVYFHFHHY